MSRVSIHGPPRENFFSSSLISMQNLVVVTHAVCTARTVAKILGTPVPPPWIAWGVAYPVETRTLPHLLSQKFGRCGSNRIGVGKGSSKRLGMLGLSPLEMGAWLTP